MDARLTEDAAETVWALEQNFLSRGRQDLLALFAPDFVSYTSDGAPLDSAQFTRYLRSNVAETPAPAELLWCAQGANDSYCLAFRFPCESQVATHLSLWRRIGARWQKQFHIFVEGEDSLEKSRPTA